METYNKKEFELLLNEILVNAGIDRPFKILLLKNQDAVKWYEKNYTNDFIEITENTKYGIKYDGLIQFDFKTGKIDNLLKSFLLQFTSKFTEYRLIDGYCKTVSIKKEILNKIIESNKNRVYNGLFYTTLYGIGFWAIFSTKQDAEVAKELSKYLQANNVDYKNQWSDAGWVYRFLINKKVEFHNELLNNFKII